MSEYFRIYLSGGMQNFGKENFDESNNWRVEAENIFNELNGYSDNNIIITCFNPNRLYSFKDEYIEDSDRTMMDNDLYYLRRSDVVLVNFNDPKSLGTMAEIAIAYEREIPVIGINVGGNNTLHSWQESICKRILYSVEEACEYIYDTYYGWL